MVLNIAQISQCSAQILQCSHVSTNLLYIDYSISTTVGSVGSLYVGPSWLIVQLLPYTLTILLYKSATISTELRNAKHSYLHN